MISYIFFYDNGFEYAEINEIIKNILRNIKSINYTYTYYEYITSKMDIIKIMKNMNKYTNYSNYKYKYALEVYLEIKNKNNIEEINKYIKEQIELYLPREYTYIEKNNLVDEFKEYLYINYKIRKMVNDKTNIPVIKNRTINTNTSKNININSEKNKNAKTNKYNHKYSINELYPFSYE
jgi:hypothetical protein